MAQNLVIPASDLTQLKQAGFSLAAPKASKPPRIALATKGKTKHGKTHWALSTTPEVVAIIMLDPGTQQVVDKMAGEGRKVMPIFIEHSKKEDQETAKKLWQRYRTAIRAVINSKSVRTLVVDTISEAWELVQLAEFGKLKQNNKFAYGGINAEFSGLIESAYYERPDLNAVYIQKVKNKYVDDKWDGKSTAPAGFANLDYLVDMSVMHGFSRDKGFFIETESSTATRFGAEYAGLEFAQNPNNECSFLDLALHIFGGNPKGWQEVGGDPEYWGVSL